MNILLTGGAGYIGSHTALTLIESGHAVTIIDNLITGTKKLIPPKAEYHKFDIADKKSSPVIERSIAIIKNKKR